VSAAAAAVADRAPAAARVMLCDDSLVIRGALSRMLEAEPGIQVVARASNGRLAVDEIQRQVKAGTPIDVVVLDIEMPVMDGLTAARLIREQLELQTLPIFALSANVTDADRMACLDAGMDQHLAKPFDLDKVVQALYPFVKRVGSTAR